MKIRLLFACMLLCSLLVIGQTNCRNLSIITEEIEQANYLKNSLFITGLGVKIERDSQYLRFEELSTCATATELQTLLQAENNVLVAYSWKAYLQKEPSDALAFLISNIDCLQSRQYAEFLNHCQGTVTKSLSRFMIDEFKKNIEIQEKEIKPEDVTQYFSFLESITIIHKADVNLDLIDF